jgi:hypothetical protein
MQITEILNVRSLDEASVLQAAYIYDIAPTDASKVLKLLGEKLPLARYNWNHVKRIRKVILDEDSKQSDESIVVVGPISPSKKEKKTKENNGDSEYVPSKAAYRLQVLLCPVSDFIYISEEIKTLLNIHIYTSAHDFCSVVNVANTVPLTRAEYDAWNMYWPIYYRPTSEDRDRSKGLMDHSVQETEQVERYMRCVLQDASNVQQMHASTAHDEAGKKGGEEGSGGVVVNPLNGAIVAVSADYFYYPLDEGKKESQDAAAMKKAKGSPSTGTIVGSSEHNQACTASRIDLSKREKLLRVHPLMDAAMRCIEVLARIAREERADPGICHPIRKETEAASNQIHTNSGSKDDLSSSIEDRAIEEDHYLLTGLDVFLTHEPDIFLAMALVHSRIRRLYYLHVNTKNGAIESNYQLHTNRNLNHRYRAFRVDMEKGV